ncbi:MAG: hypothetical protein A3F74_21620 [Betaproteobacteria bacterium RIFCSPLOWO2_12_FULL_62_58]|nr:MAG: hypothetical protein A3F74_21620 [Betaproteobacteria bacterium RIFCSPLOWO2_12_FULL_62_58]
MIFMSQSGITDPARAVEWDAWYVEHLRIMLTVPGISSTQRFKTDSPGYPPSLAMYIIAGAEIFDDPYYRSVRGMGEWLPLIDKQHYRRNLFEGLDAAPDVPDDCVLLVADRAAPESDVSGVVFSWLKTVGLDRSTPYRGIAVVTRTVADRLASTRAIGIYRPVSARNQQR